jgi:hypothetical protein
MKLLDDAPEGANTSTLPALTDLGLIPDYITPHSPQGAWRVESRIPVVIDLLPAHPNIGTRTNDPPHDGVALPFSPR